MKHTGILKAFEPKIYNDSHDKFNEFFKFEMTMDIQGVEVKGEAMSKDQNGSKHWKIGKEHEFEKKEQQYAVGGIAFRGIKTVELVPTSSTSSSPSAYNITKEAYTVARFGHTMALQFLETISEKERKDMVQAFAEKDITTLPKEALDAIIVNAGRKLVSKLAKQMSESVDRVAMELVKSHEGGDAKAS